jgi:transcriptional regulator with XRE-family HTH domain
MELNHILILIRKIKMTLGQRIKQLRLEKELNQPELAQAIGIEQSYLSKLENDKAFPSDEMFEKLLHSFEITIEEFLIGFNQSTINNQLMKLSAVNKTQTHLNTKSAKYMLRWIFMSAMLAVVGFTLLIAGEQRWIFTEERNFQYVYQSTGIVKKDESLLMYQDEPHRLENSVLARIDPKTVKLSEKNGRYFVRKVDGGTRYYVYDKVVLKNDNRGNDILRVIGLLLAMLGIVGLIIEPKIRRIKLATS